MGYNRQAEQDAERPANAVSGPRRALRAGRKGDKSNNRPVPKRDRGLCKDKLGPFSDAELLREVWRRAERFQPRPLLSATSLRMRAKEPRQRGESMQRGVSGGQAALR